MLLLSPYSKSLEWSALLLQWVISQQKPPPQKKVLSFPLLAVQATVFCTLQFCTSICLLKCNLYSTFSPTRSVFMSIAVPLLQPQIQLTVSENRLTLAKSYFTGTVKQKNNSKVCLSRKPVWKFNKWLFLSQCSHNWWSEMGMDVRQRFRFSELIVIRISCEGGSWRSAGLPQSPHRTLLMWQHKSNQDEVWKTGGDYSLHDLHHVGKLANQFIHTQSFKLKEKSGEQFL